MVEEVVVGGVFPPMAPLDLEAGAGKHHCPKELSKTEARQIKARFQ
jgi:hypothetical protein